MFQTKEYIKFLWRSTNHHGVHSPFVFNLVTKCLYDQTRYDSYNLLEDAHRALRKDETILKIKDLGAGSKIDSGSERKVSTIAKTSSSPLPQVKLMYRLANYLRPKSILELGTSLGLSTQAMALGSPHAKIITIEGADEVAKFTQNRLEELEDRIEIRNGSFKDQLQHIGENKFDLIFIDGHHTKEATLEYFETLLPHAYNDSIFIFDDIYWSKGMKEAWEIIKNHKEVKVTVDLFYKGLVFFRKEQAKEHFCIRL